MHRCIHAQTHTYTPMHTCMHAHTHTAIPGELCCMNFSSSPQYFNVDSSTFLYSAFSAISFPQLLLWFCGYSIPAEVSEMIFRLTNPFPPGAVFVLVGPSIVWLSSLATCSHTQKEGRVMLQVLAGIPAASRSVYSAGRSSSWEGWHECPCG